jgi:hypothetical protein
MKNSILLTGPPRSGTTLVCNLLNKLPNVVALHEPILMGRLAKTRHADGPRGDIIRFVQESRESLLSLRKAWTKQLEGEVPTNPVVADWNDQTLRPGVHTRAFITFDKPLSANFLLAVKHNDGFVALLPQLAQRFTVFGIVRNPLATLASWNTVKMAIQNGRSPVAETLDLELKAALDARVDRWGRQLFILDRYFQRLLDHLPRDHIIEYEKTIISGGRSLSVITPRAATLNEDLRSLNSEARYGHLMKVLAPGLLDSEGAYWKIYSRANVEAMVGN